MADGANQEKPISLFYSYSHQDEVLRGELEAHLSFLRRSKLIAEWHDRMIGAGEEWKGQIDRQLAEADIILLLVSADFIASDYCWGEEMTKALARHQLGDARVIPVILRPCQWQRTPLGSLQAVPKDGKPVSEWPNHDVAFDQIAVAVERTVTDLQQQRRRAAEQAQQRAEEARKRQAAEEQQREALQRQREQEEAQKQVVAEARQVAEQQQREPSASIAQRQGDQDIVIDQEKIRTRFQELPDPATVTMSTRLAVDRDRWQDFVLSEADERTLRKKINAWTDQFFVNQVPLRDAYERSRDVERQLRATLDDHLKEFGRTTTSLHLLISFPFSDPPQQLVFEHRVSCHIKEQTEQVTVTHKVLIKLEDIAKWVAEGKKDPVVYLRSRLEDETQDVLFDKNYLQLILAFNRRSRNGNGGEENLSELEARIKGKMAAHAQGIGYDIKQYLLIAEPNLF
jgi:hypothetical protein